MAGLNGTSSGMTSITETRGSFLSPLWTPSPRSEKYPEMLRVARISVKGRERRRHPMVCYAQWAPELLNELFVVVNFSDTRYRGPVGGVDVDEVHVYACAVCVRG